MWIAVVPVPFVETTFLSLLNRAVLGFNEVTSHSECRESRSECREVCQEAIAKISQGGGSLDKMVAAEVVRNGWVLDIF